MTTPTTESKLKTNEPIVINRVANGFQVGPTTRPELFVCIGDLMVFQDMGYASAARDYQNTEDTLLGFIAAHFSGPKDGERK